jgi:hypothetical protein
MYAVNPLEKDSPYSPPDYMPPYHGRVYGPALPSATGDFDHIPVESEQFLAAHLYGTVRHTLDVWESYLRRRVVWWHADVIPQVELIPIVHWPNAHSGPGFIEMGRQPNRFGQLQPFCLNFDVIAHETGHAILFSQIGVPPMEHLSEQFLAFHESFADLIAVIGVMNRRSVRQKLLTQTNGNLYVLNLVNRIGAYSDSEQIRLASNLATMRDVDGLSLRPDGTWIDPKGLNRNQHAIAEPLTGAVFDILVEIYQDGLVSRHLIHPDMDARGWTRHEIERALDIVHRESARAFACFAQGFFAALDDARHAVGHCMAHVMRTVRPETLSFPLVAARFLEAAAALGLGPILPAAVDHFLWRGIDPRAHLTLRIEAFPARRAQRLLGRPTVMETPNTTPGCRCLDRSGFISAHRFMTHPHRAQAEWIAR